MTAPEVETVPVAEESIASDSGDCSQALPGEGPYTVDGAEAGRLVCYESLGYTSFDWTHEPTLIAGSLVHDGGTAAAWEWRSVQSGPTG